MVRARPSNSGVVAPVIVIPMEFVEAAGVNVLNI